jgi:chromosome segregation ATPase
MHIGIGFAQGQGARRESMTATTQESRDSLSSKRLVQSEAAVTERGKMGQAVQELRDALAAASWQREQRWHRMVQNALATLHSALQETRESADTTGSLLSQVVTEAPRLQARVERVREQYASLEQNIGSLRDQLGFIESELPEQETRKQVEEVRRNLHEMLMALHHIEAAETELLYEAFEVDIGEVD